MERLGRFFDPSFENGGYVDSENPDLYEFNYGGYDPTQQDMDYSNSIDTTDPYFQRGGGVRRFIENFVPANVLSNPNTYYNEVQRIYDPRTGKTIPMPSNMGRVSSINVDKSRFWSGKPKKYTVNFNGSPDYTVTSPNQNNSSSQKDNKQKNSQWSNVKGLNLGSKIAIRKGELGNKINDWKLKRQGLDEYGNPKGSKQSDKVPLSNEEMLIKNEHRLLKCQLNIDQKLQDIATINPALRDLVFSIHQEIEIILKITQKG
jgi:hypothetical protein